jgi:hypothetical protein
MRVMMHDNAPRRRSGRHDFPSNRALKSHARPEAVGVSNSNAHLNLQFI